jgi:transcriptional regulator with XRE-family HTH domain
VTTLAENFAKQLKRTRTRKKWSQEALAQEAHLSTSMLSMLERSKREPSFSTIEQLAAALGVRPLDLLKAA